MERFSRPTHFFKGKALGTRLVAAQGNALKTGHVIKSGGSLTLTREQDTLSGGFDVSQSFIGMLTNVNVWAHVLSPAEIARMSKSCLSGEGNVYKWSDFIHGLKGQGKPEQLFHLLANQWLPNYKFAKIKRCKCSQFFTCNGSEFSALKRLL